MRLFIAGLGLVLMVGCGRIHDYRTIVLVVAGQSNAVSDARDHAPVELDRGVSIYTGWPAERLQSPVSTSIVWALAANHLARETGRPVLIVNIAVGGTSSWQWANGMDSTIVYAIRQFHPDAILWHQGEADAVQATTAQDTYENLKSIIGLANLSFPYRKVPWYVALNSDGVHDNPRIAEARIIAEGVANAGPDTDVLRVPEDTVDNRIHFAGPGLDKHAELWESILKAIPGVSL